MITMKFEDGAFFMRSEGVFLIPYWRIRHGKFCLWIPFADNCAASDETGKAVLGLLATRETRRRKAFFAKAPKWADNPP